MKQRDAPTRIADRTRGFHVILDLDGHHLTAREPHENRRRRYADGDHRIAEARAEECGKRDRQDEEWAGQHRVGDAADQSIEKAAEISGAQPERHADRKRDADRNHAGHQRSARAEDHAGEHVAADLVGAEPMQRRWRLAHGEPALRNRIVRRHPGRPERREVNPR